MTDTNDRSPSKTLQLAWSELMILCSHTLTQMSPSCSLSQNTKIILPVHVAVHEAWDFFFVYSLV